MLAEKLLDMTRQVTGTTEVTSGEMIGANMAASAIIALQNQAKKPNEGYQNKLFRSMKRSGRIWEEFYKVYYNMPRPISTTDEDGNQETRQFTGTDYADMGFGLKIDVGPASVFSESLQMTVLDKMHDKGDIDKYQYAKYAPSNVIPSQLKQDFEKEQKQLIEQQQAQQQLQQQQPNLSSIISQLSPEEQAILKQHPELLQQVMGGVANGPMPTVPAQR
jgi:hypothetical protein